MSSETQREIHQWISYVIENNDENGCTELFATLRLVFRNILDHPNDVTKRRLNVHGPKSENYNSKIGRFMGARELLQAVGYELQGARLVLAPSQTASVRYCLAMLDLITNDRRANSAARSPSESKASASVASPVAAAKSPSASHNSPSSRASVPAVMPAEEKVPELESVSVFTAVDSPSNAKHASSPSPAVPAPVQRCASGADRRIPSPPRSAAVDGGTPKGPAAEPGCDEAGEDSLGVQTQEDWFLVAPPVLVQANARKSGAAPPEAPKAKTQTDIEEERQLAVEQLCQMGFEISTALAALQINGFDLSRSAEYLVRAQREAGVQKSIDRQANGEWEVVSERSPFASSPKLPGPLGRAAVSSSVMDPERKARIDEEERASQKLIAQLQKEDEQRRKKLDEALKKDRQAVRKMLVDRKKAGEALSLAEHNFVNAPADHEDGKAYQCIVCFSDFQIEELVILDECNHFLCVDCMRTYMETQIANGRSKDLKCPHDKCKRLVGFDEVRRVVKGPSFEKYQQFLLEGHLKMDPDCRWCPRPGCGVAMIGDKKHPMMRCPNPKCKFTMCFNCKVEWHADTTCEKYQEWLSENKAADDRYSDWAKQNTKPCPKCKAPIQKNGGCNHMTCAGCRHQYCWLCFQDYKVGHYALDERSPCYKKQYT